MRNRLADRFRDTEVSGELDVRRSRSFTGCMDLGIAIRRRFGTDVVNGTRCTCRLLVATTRSLSLRLAHSTAFFLQYWYHRHPLLGCEPFAYDLVKPLAVFINKDQFQSLSPTVTTMPVLCDERDHAADTNIGLFQCICPLTKYL